MRRGKLEKYCEVFNAEHHNKGILNVVPNSLGATYNVNLGVRPILTGVTEREAFLAVAAIKNYADAQEGR